MLKLQETKEIKEAKKFTHSNNEGEYKYVAYYFADGGGKPIPFELAAWSNYNKYVYHKVCFAALTGSSGFLKRPEALNMTEIPEYVVYIPKLRYAKKEVALAYLKEVVGKFHWFKDVIVDFDPERIWESHLVAVPFKTPRLRVLTSFNMVRYLDEFPSIVQNWYDRVVKGDKPNTWAQFRECHKLEDVDPYSSTIWDHALFKPHMPGVTFDVPKEEKFEKTGSVKAVFVGEE